MRRDVLLIVFATFALAAAVCHAAAPAPQVRAWQVLTSGVHSKKFSERILALKALSDLGPNPKGVRLVAGVMKDKDPDVRAQAAATLGEMKSRLAISPLRIALSDPAPQVSFAAAKSLWQLGDTTGRRVLLDVLQGDKATKDGFVAGQVRDIHRDLQDKKALAVMGAEKGAGELLPGPLSMGVGLVKQQFIGGTDQARADSAALLSRRPDKETMLAFKTALMDHDWAVRAAAAKAIGRLGRPGTERWLEYSLDDSKPAVRYEAAVGILRMASHPQRPPNYARLR